MKKIIADITKLQKFEKQLLLKELTGNPDAENRLRRYYMSLAENDRTLLADHLLDRHKAYFVEHLAKSGEWQNVNIAEAEHFLMESLKKVQQRSEEMQKSSENIMYRAKERRALLKANYADWYDLISDQMRGQPVKVQKDYPEYSTFIQLPDPKSVNLCNDSIMNFMLNRKSVRKYSQEPLTLNELSYLLWCTQGVREISSNREYTLRTVPSSGARHPFETYLFIKNVNGLKKGIYRFMALEHQLLFLSDDDSFECKLLSATENWLKNAAVIFMWSVIPYRSEWRYMDKAAKSILLDAGHVGQNLYLACESINCGTSTIAGYFQDQIDEALQLDGEEEFVIYLAPVGKKTK